MHRAIRPLRLAAVLFALAGCSDRAADAVAHAQPPAAPAAPTQEELIRRGEQLVRLGGCGDCHTPMQLDPKLGMPVPRMDRMLSGHPAGGPEPKAKPGAGDQGVIGATFTSFRLPFGTVYAANLTPDEKTGLGSWTADEFVKTMRSGRHRGTGRAIMPPMPWQNLSQQPEAELRAIFAYLRSIPAIDNRVPEVKVPPEVIAAIAKTTEAAAH